MSGSGNMRELILLDEKDLFQPEGGKKGKKKWVLIIVLIVIAAALVAGAIWLYYHSRVEYGERWYPHSTLNGVDVSGMTLEESRAAVIDKMENYSLTVTGRENGSLVIHADEIDYHVKLSDEFEKRFEEEHAHLAFPWSEYSWKMPGKVSYDKKKLKKKLKYSEILQGSINYVLRAPHPTRIAFSEESRQVVVEDAYEGNTLKEKPFSKAVREALDGYETTLDLTEKETASKVYKSVDEKESKEELESRLDEYNRRALHYVKWEMPDGSKEKLEPEQIYSWLSWKDDRVDLDTEKLTEYLHDLSDKYTTVGKSRTVKGHDGGNFILEGGDFGWSLSYDQLYDQANEALYDEVDEDDLKSYKKEQSKKNTEKLTHTYKAPFTSTGQKFNKENPIQDFDKKNFTEVDLADQQVYIFRDGKVVHQFNCISGRPGGKRQTRPGTFYVKEKEYYRVLKGDDYETPVNYWVRITNSGVGFHAAPWQGWGSWSPTYYIYGGSHGCINLSTTNAKTVYETVESGEAVFMHY